MTFKSKTPPLCRFCGHPIAKTTVIVYLPPSGLNESYANSNRWSRWLDARAKSKAECQRLTNGHVLSIKYSNRTIPPMVSSFNEWDGESYKEAHFCTDRCAAAFARSALIGEPELCTQAYRDALRKQGGKK